MPASQLAGLSLAVASAIFNGSFAAFSKLRAASLVHPLIFNLYVAAGVCLSSCLALPFMPLVGSPPVVCPWGVVAGLLFVSATSLSFVAVSSGLGLSSGQGVWSGSSILISLAWGTLGPQPLGLPVASVPLTTMAVVLLLAGVFGIVKVEQIGSYLGTCCSQKDVQAGATPKAPLVAHTASSHPDAADAADASERVVSGTAASAAISSTTPSFTSIAASTSSSAAARDASSASSRLVGLFAALFVGIFGG